MVGSGRYISDYMFSYLGAGNCLPPSVRARLSTSRANFDAIFVSGLDYNILLVSRIAKLRLQRYFDRSSISRRSWHFPEVRNASLHFRPFSTFIVRTVLVPATLLLAQSWNWWQGIKPPSIFDAFEDEVHSSGALSRPTGRFVAQRCDWPLHRTLSDGRSRFWSLWISCEPTSLCTSELPTSRVESFSPRGQAQLHLPLNCASLRTKLLHGCTMR